MSSCVAAAIVVLSACCVYAERMLVASMVLGLAAFLLFALFAMHLRKMCRLGVCSIKRFFRKHVFGQHRRGSPVDYSKSHLGSSSSHS